MTTALSPTTRLVELITRTARGPKREGIYALWLVVRAAELRRFDPPVAPKLLTRQLDALIHRVATLTPPAPIRRAVASALTLLADPAPGASAAALHQLVAPAREALGGDVADAIGAAARAAREAKR